MCEVLKSNFDAFIPIIEKRIQSSDFIAIDIEFTGLKLSEYDRPSLFDSGEDRYKKLKKSVSNFSISQIGLSMFCQDKIDDSKYHAYSYNFYLFPSSFGPVDVRFLIQASCFEFLAKHKFDFNKYVYEGISFLNETQEEKLRKHLEQLDHVKGLDRDVDERSLQEYCSKVAAWVVKAEEGDKLSLDSSQEVPDLILMTELKQRFKNVWTSEEDGQVVVEKMSTEKRAKLDSENKQKDEQSIMSRMVGFSQVFKALVRSKKPLIGHNNLTDLVLMYDKFYKPLPEKYSTFKADIINMFPRIFDTKHIVLNLRRPFEETELLNSTSLGDLYQSRSSERGRFYVLCSPTIIHGDGCESYKHNHHPHEAGYDAFMCGYVFLRMAHLYATIDIKSTVVHAMPFLDYLNALKPYMNSVNMIRASVNHIRLDDHDPQSNRPQWLYVRSRSLKQSGLSAELARLFSPYGSVDIQLKDPSTALVAVSNHRCSREILQAFHKHSTIRVVKYRPWKHSLYLRGFMWSGVVLFGSISVLTLYFGLKDPSPAS